MTYEKKRKKLTPDVAFLVLCRDDFDIFIVVDELKINGIENSFNIGIVEVYVGTDSLIEACLFINIIEITYIS